LEGLQFIFIALTSFYFKP